MTMPIELSGDEIDALVYAAGPDANHEEIVSAVECVLAARLEPINSLADAWDDRAWRGHDVAAPFVRAIRNALSA